MNSIGFPKMFQGNSTIIFDDEENKASMSCLHLLLGSEAGTLFGDPDFGIKLRRYLFDQNNYVLRDILIDELYTKISIFCPQLYLERKNIRIDTDGSKLYARITCKNQENFQTNTYNLVLYESEELK